jgi:hypothetical protein
MRPSIPGPPVTLGTVFSTQVTTHPPWVRFKPLPESNAPRRIVVDRQPAINAMLRREAQLRASGRK